MTDHLDYASLANYVYFRDPVNRTPLTDGWEELVWQEDDSHTGFSAGAYRRGNEIVISLSNS